MHPRSRSTWGRRSLHRERRRWRSRWGRRPCRRSEEPVGGVNAGQAPNPNARHTHFLVSARRQRVFLRWQRQECSLLRRWRCVQQSVRRWSARSAMWWKPRQWVRRRAVVASPSASDACARACEWCTLIVSLSETCCSKPSPGYSPAGRRRRTILCCPESSREKTARYIWIMRHSEYVWIASKVCTYSVGSRSARCSGKGSLLLSTARR